MADDFKSTIRSRRRSPLRWLWLLVLLTAATAVANHHYQWYPWPWVEKPPVMPLVKIPAKTEPPVPQLIDFQKLKDKSDPTLENTINQRKEDFGLDTSVDMVVSQEESIRVGEETIPLAEILARIENQEIDPDSLPVIHLPTDDRALDVQDLSENDTTPIAEKIEPLSESIPAKAISDYYGVYVVRAGDNLWDIHFAILREYLKKKNIDLPVNADERRTRNGKSSGVSRILKYAESMVHIFNMKTRTISSNLDMLEPETKVVVLNLSHLNRILGAIRPENLDQVHYDGKELYLPD